MKNRRESGTAAENEKIPTPKAGQEKDIPRLHFK